MAAPSPRMSRRAVLVGGAAGAAAVLFGPGAHLAAAPGPAGSAQAGGTADTRTFGADALGTTRYTIPGGTVRYVKPGGSDAADGTSFATAWQTVAHAMATAPAGATVVLCANVAGRLARFREGGITRASAVTIMNRPGDGALLLGSTVMSGAVADGPNWRYDGWTFAPSRTTYDQGPFVDTADHPYAGWPDQVFVDGEPLAEVGSLAEMSAGTFFADRVGQALYVRLADLSAPADHTVEASTEEWALHLQGAGSVIKGIWWKHYATTYTHFGAVRVTGSNSLVEHCGGERCHNGPLSVQAGTGTTVRNFTSGFAGHQGMHSFNAPDLLVEWSWFHHANQERFLDWAAAGCKLTGKNDPTNATYIEGATVRHCLFEDNAAQGLWLDVWIKDFVVVNNVCRRNEQFGMSIEVCGHGVVANNVCDADNRMGIYLSETHDVEVCHNTIITSGSAARADDYTLRVFDGARTNSSGVLTGVVANVALRNNVLVAGPHVDRLFSVFAAANDRTYAAMVSVQNGTVYHRLAGPLPATLVQAPVSAGANSNYETLTAWRSASGRDGTAWHKASDTLPIVGGGDYRLLPSHAATGGGVAIPQAVADAIGVSQTTGLTPGVMYPWAP